MNMGHDRVRMMQASDLARVLGWRNHPDVRRFMYSQHEISPQEHQAWFNQHQQNPAKTMLIFEAAGVPQGFVQFTRRTGESPIADWGFYIAPDAPKGTGRRMGLAALSFAFNELNLHKVCGEAFGYNAASIGFHQAMGFVQEGERRARYFDGTAYHSVILFGLLKSAWPHCV
ncbi:MAG: UDP-4-amino-4,6-dideoxy-N-acetyl-beta-L-altrosamine N-acetyltransferase [Halothiobacillus sp.]